MSADGACTTGTTCAWAWSPLRAPFLWRQSPGAYATLFFGGRATEHPRAAAAGGAAAVRRTLTVCVRRHTGVRRALKGLPRRTKQAAGSKQRGGAQREGRKWVLLEAEPRRPPAIRGRIHTHTHVTHRSGCAQHRRHFAKVPLPARSACLHRAPTGPSTAWNRRV